MASPREILKHQRGAIMVWMALFLVLMMCFIGFAVDASKMAATRAQLQATADAAALAGASAVDPDSGRIVKDQAVARAELMAAQNKAFVDGSVPVVVEDGDVQVSTDLTECTVTVYRDAARGTGIVTYFAKLFGQQNTYMHATATAKVVHPNEQCCNLVPMGAVPPISGPFQTGCVNGIYTLKVASGQGTTGNYGLVDFPPCDQGACADNQVTGGAQVKCLMANGYCCCIAIGTEIQTEPGNKIGPVNQGLTDRFRADTDQRTNICYSDYRGNGKRVVFVPQVTPFSNGRTTVTITGFLAFFLRDIPQNDTVKAEFLYDNAPGDGSGGTGTTVAIHLIK